MTTSQWPADETETHRSWPYPSVSFCFSPFLGSCASPGWLRRTGRDQTRALHTAQGKAGPTSAHLTQPRAAGRATGFWEEGEDSAAGQKPQREGDGEGVQGSQASRSVMALAHRCRSVARGAVARGASSHLIHTAKNPTPAPHASLLPRPLPGLPPEDSCPPETLEVLRLLASQAGPGAPRGPSLTPGHREVHLNTGAPSATGRIHSRDHTGWNSRLPRHGAETPARHPHGVEGGTQQMLARNRWSLEK